MDVQATLNQVQENFREFFEFVANKLNNFPNLSLPEQIGFGCVGLGIFLVLLSLILFVLL